MTRKPKFELKIEHIVLATALNFKPHGRWWENDPLSFEFIPEIDPKRPFGNSGCTYDVAQRLNLLKEAEDGDKPMTAEIERLAMRYIIELPVALEVIMANRTFDLGLYETDRHSAYFAYREHMAIWFWLDAVKACADLRDSQGHDLFARAFTFSATMSWNPYEILKDMRTWSDTSDDLKALYTTFRDYACNRYRKNHPEAAGWDPEAIVAVLIQDGDPTDDEWPFWAERLENEKNE